MYRSFTPLMAAMLAATGLSAAPAVRVNQAGEAKLAKLLEGRIAGKPTSCVQNYDLRSSQIIDGTAIVYEGAGRTLYVNRPDIGADWLRSDDILVTKTSTSQLCSLDTVRLVSQGSHIERGFVGLGKFVPYTKPRRR
ncbi:MAG TPA: hypothetical protein VNT42_05820 [Sphingomonas sp.]|nr:hypothetical protein [Sphingomonas sp.]